MYAFHYRLRYQSVLMASETSIKIDSSSVIATRANACTHFAPASCLRYATRRTHAPLSVRRQHSPIHQGHVRSSQSPLPRPATATHTSWKLELGDNRHGSKNQPTSLPKRNPTRSRKSQNNTHKDMGSSQRRPSRSAALSRQQFLWTICNLPRLTI